MTLLAALFPQGLSLSQNEVLLAVERGVEEAAVDVLSALLTTCVHVHARRVARSDSVDACAADDIAAAVANNAAAAARPVLIDCLHALRVVSGARDASTTLHRLARGSAGGAAAVVPAASPACSAQLLRSAHHILVVDGLVSGAARDVHGTVQVVKRDGRWRRNVGEGVFRFRVREDGNVHVFP